MKEALVAPGPKVQIIDSPIPQPEPDQIITKVVVSGSNPKDWKVPEWRGVTANQGDDIAGIVHSVGSNVYEFKSGDRVAAFHQMQAPGGSYAEYAISWAHTTFHIPQKISFEEAATLPLAAMTAAVGLYQRLGLPLPWHPALDELPLIIYGAATAVGSFAIQLARSSNIHPLICVAGKGASHVEGLIDKSRGDVIVDYREGDEHLVHELKSIISATKSGTVSYAFDCVAEKGSEVNIARVLSPSGAITLVLPSQDPPEVPKTISKSLTMVGCVHRKSDPDPWEQKTGGESRGNEDFAFAMFRFMARGLQQGWFKPHPYEIRAGGLGGVQKALEDLKDGKASAVKYVFKIVDTDGAGKD